MNRLGPAIRTQSRPLAMPRLRRGVSLIGLLFWGALLGCVGVVAIRVTPAVAEYFTIQRIVKQVAAGNASTVAEVRAAFDRQREIETGITAIAGKDLEVTKENDKVVVSFAYGKEVPLYGPVALLIKFDGSSK